MGNSRFKIYTDGGSRGNPGKAAYGFVVYAGSEKIFEEGKQIGTTTNNVAEYSGVVAALEWFISQQIVFEKIDFFMDSQLVANQLNGKFKLKNPGLRPLFLKAKECEKKLGNVTYTAVPREQNKEADRMVNLALDDLLDF